MLLPLACCCSAPGWRWWRWRRDPAADPAAALGPLRPVFARAFCLDDVQHALVVRPVRALARAARAGDEAVVDGAVEAPARARVGLGGGLAALHRARCPGPRPRCSAGALLLGLAAVADRGRC